MRFRNQLGVYDGGISITAPCGMRIPLSSCITTRGSATCDASVTDTADVEAMPVELSCLDDIGELVWMYCVSASSGSVGGAGGNGNCGL